MIRAEDLISKFEQAFLDHWGYIYGTAGILWTEERQKATEDEMAREYGARWIGHMVADCSGLFAWAFRKLGGEIAHGSNSIWDRYLSSKGKLQNGNRADGRDLKPGTAVFKLKDGDDRHHIGLYIGQGLVIEAKGTRYGVVNSPVGEWDEWGELKSVDYNGGGGDAMPDILYTGTVAAEKGKKVNLRKGPSLKDALIEQVPIGEKVDVLEDLGEWLKVRAGNSTGYMQEKYVIPDGTGIMDTVPVPRIRLVEMEACLADALGIIKELKGGS